MLKRALILAISTILLTSCTWHRVQSPPKIAPTPPPRVTITQRTADFTKIKIVGKIDVHLHTGTKFNKIVFQGATEDINSVERGVKDDELFITINNKRPKFGQLKVDIYTHRISSFSYHGSGNIYANGITSKCINLDIDNNKNVIFDGSFGINNAKFSNGGYYKIRGIRGCVTNLSLMNNVKAKITGHSNVANINMGDNSELTLYWVKSKTLKVKLKDNARAKLSGVTEVLNAELWNQAKLDSRHLMSQISFVKTHDVTEAYIAVVKNQHTLANDRSNIYYYFLPETRTDFMAKDGSVLDMREWNRPFIKN